MKQRLLALSLAVAFGAIAGCAAYPRERILYKQYAGYNYCHMKIERPGSDPARYHREIVDYYGPCDDRPQSEERITWRSYE